MNVWVKSAHDYYEQEVRTVCYFSAEFLIGPQLGMNLLRLGIHDAVEKAADELGIDLDALIEYEGEPGLGSGGLGRLAACFMESLATLEVPAIGYGVRYEFGIFDQEIRDGWQVEVADRWLRLGNPWEIAHPEIRVEVKFGGRTESYSDSAGRFRVRWIPDHIVMGTPCDTPILGYRRTARPTCCGCGKPRPPSPSTFRPSISGDYYGAVHDKVDSENITKVLYPNDETMQGRELRLKQQYFFVSCSLKDMIRIHLQRERTLHSFHEKYAVQLNDTHPSLAIPELMRLLVDEHLLDWDAAWNITQRTFGYTNHTLLPEALERWPVPLFAQLAAPASGNHLRNQPAVSGRGAAEDTRAMRIAFEGFRLSKNPASSTCAWPIVACVGSHAINGVAELHTRLLESEVLADFYDMMPQKFSNKTNGVTARRFLLLSNPRLSRLITESIGDSWVKDLEQLRKPGAACTRPGIPGGVAAGQTAKQDRPRASRSGNDRHQDRSAAPV